MNKDELYKFLDIETGEDFQYFENFADLAEYDGEINSDVIFQLVKEIDMKTFAELCESYFEEMEENIPDAQIDIFNLIENIKRVLIGLSQSVNEDDPSSYINMADQLNGFRLWYSEESSVECRNLSNEEISNVPVRDALLISRLEKMGNERFSYDFEDALDYELDEYIMTFADLVTD